MSINMGYPSINMKKTGENIKKLRDGNNIKVHELAEFMGFNGCQAIYKWQRGDCLPTIDNLLALSRLFGVPIEGILVEDDEMPADIYHFVFSSVVAA